jgi:hypothetical protein
MVTFEWYDISLCDEARHCMLMERITTGSCATMIRKFLMHRLTEINKLMHSSTLPDIGKLVYSSFRRKLNDDINFIDEFF